MNNTKWPRAVDAETLVGESFSGVLLLFAMTGGATKSAFLLNRKVSKVNTVNFVHTYLEIIFERIKNPTA